MKKYYLIFGIIIVLIVIGVIVAVNFRSQPEPTGGDVMMNALQVFNSNTTITSEQDAKNLIISNSDKIMEGTLNLWNQYPELIRQSRYTSFKNSYKTIIDSVGNNWQFGDSEVKLRGCCAGGFWAGNDSEKYVVTVLSSTTGTREIVTCNNPAEQNYINEQGKTSNCGGSGVKERKTVDVNSILMYIIDDSGKVYFAGAYSNQN